MVQNAAASVADAIFLDLEDAVPPAEKAAALEAAATALTALDWGNKTAISMSAVPRTGTWKRRSICSPIR
jgi:malyl-CoA/(S)-citramalyl-CoA lyase